MHGARREQRWRAVLVPGLQRRGPERAACVQRRATASSSTSSGTTPSTRRARRCNRWRSASSRCGANACVCARTHHARAPRLRRMRPRARRTSARRRRASLRSRSSCRPWNARRRMFVLVGLAGGRLPALRALTERSHAPCAQRHAACQAAGPADRPARHQGGRVPHHACDRRTSVGGALASPLASPRSRAARPSLRSMKEKDFLDKYETLEDFAERERRAEEERIKAEAKREQARERPAGGRRRER
jgi:hypothetical protein